jgi:hypothetical protein
MIALLVCNFARSEGHLFPVTTASMSKTVGTPYENHHILNHGRISLRVTDTLTDYPFPPRGPEPFRVLVPGNSSSGHSIKTRVRASWSVRFGGVPPKTARIAPSLEKISTAIILFAMATSFSVLGLSALGAS